MKVSSSRDGLFYLLVLVIYLLPTSDTAPVLEDGTQAMQTVDGGSGCYYNFEHYYEGDRILTNEPCLNCTCHNRMLMCYLRVCPFTKGIGQDCTVEKKPDQCCPVITCPQVPVALLTSSTTQQPPSTTALGRPDNYGCILNQNTFYPDGAQVPSDPKKPCELCYCIRNHTACVMQECTLNVEGCKPVFQEGVCCPVRYDCDYEDALTTQRPTTVGLVTTPGGPSDCLHDGSVYHDGEMVTVDSSQPCEHCYCMRGDIVCAVQDCGTPLQGSDCTPLEPPPGQCCPTTYQCANGTVPIKGHEIEEGDQVKETPEPPHDEGNVEIQSGEEVTPESNEHDKSNESSQSKESEEDNTSHEQTHPETTSTSSANNSPGEAVDQHQPGQVVEFPSHGDKDSSSFVTNAPEHETTEVVKDSTVASEVHSNEKHEEDDVVESTSEEVEKKPEVPGGQEVVKEVESPQTQEETDKQTVYDAVEPTKPTEVLSEDHEEDADHQHHHQPSVEDSESQPSTVQSVEHHETDDVAVQGQNNNHLATNEIPEVISTAVHSPSNEQGPVEWTRVPGEGSCLVDGKTYPPDSEVPPSPDSCHKSCRCVNSIVLCERIECPLPPSNYANCMPVPDSCCPTYMCDQAPSDAPEVQNQLNIDKLDTNLNEEGTMVVDNQAEHQTPASISENESTANSGSTDEADTVPPPVIFGIPPENLVPGADEIPLQPAEPSEQNQIANHEDSTSSASSDSHVSQHVNEVNNVDDTEKIPITPVKSDESAIHEGSPEEEAEHHNSKPVENNLVDGHKHHNHVDGVSEGGIGEQHPQNEHSDSVSGIPELIYNEYVTTENHLAQPEVGDVHSEEPTEHTFNEHENSEVNGSGNEEVTVEEVTQHHVFEDELEETNESNKQKIDQDSTVDPHNHEDHVSVHDHDITSQDQDHSESFTDHSVGSNLDGYTTEGPNEPVNHSESHSTMETSSEVQPEQELPKETEGESISSDHVLEEGTASSLDPQESEGSNDPNPVAGSEQPFGEVEGSTQKTLETGDNLNENGVPQAHSEVTQAETTESELNLNQDAHHEEVTASGEDHHSSPSEGYLEVTPSSEPSSVHEGNTDEVVATERDEVLAATEQSLTSDFTHEQEVEEHDQVHAVDVNQVVTTEAEESHDQDANVDGQQSIPTESSLTDTQTDATEEQPNEKHPEEDALHSGNAEEHASPSGEHTEVEKEQPQTEIAHDNEHSELPQENTETENDEIYSATENSHIAEELPHEHHDEIHDGSTKLPDDFSSHAPSTASPVTDDGHYLEVLHEGGDKNTATDKPDVVDDLPSTSEELPTKEEDKEVTSSAEVTVHHTTETSSQEVIQETLHVPNTHEESHVGNTEEEEEEEEKEHHMPDGVHEESKLDKPTTEHQQSDLQTEEEVTHHIELHEDVPVSSITSDDHRITENESQHSVDQHVDVVNAVVEDTVKGNEDSTTETVEKPTSHGKDSENGSEDHSANEDTGIHESHHDEQENGSVDDQLEGSADSGSNNNGLLETTSAPAIISEEELVPTEENVDLKNPAEETQTEEHTEDHSQEEPTSTENFHLFDMSTPAHQVLPITPGPPGIDIHDLIHKEESSTVGDVESEESTEHHDNVATNLETHTDEPSLDETLPSEHIPEETGEEGEQKGEVYPEVASGITSESEVTEQTDHHALSEETHNETTEPVSSVEESNTHVPPSEEHSGESVSSESPAEVAVSESEPTVVESDEKHVTEGVPSTEEHSESGQPTQHADTDHTEVVHQDEELSENDHSQNANVPAENAETTTNAGVPAEQTTHGNVQEAEPSSAPENVSEKGVEVEEEKTEENLTAPQEDKVSENKEPTGVVESVTESEASHEESTHAFTSYDEMPFYPSLSEIEGMTVQEQSGHTPADEVASPVEVTETVSHEGIPEEPVKVEEHTEKAETVEHTAATSSDTENENIFVSHVESSSSKAPASDNQLLDTTEQHFDEGPLESSPDSSADSNTAESSTAEAVLISETKPEQPGHSESHVQESTDDENLTTPASGGSETHQEGEEHLSAHTETSADSVLEGSGLEETSSIPAVPIESQPVPQSSFETTTFFETLFGSSSTETSTSDHSEVHEESISQSADLASEEHVTEATDKHEDVKQDHVPEESTTSAGVHAEAEPSHAETEEPVKEATESTSEVVLGGHVSESVPDETVTHTEESSAPSGADKATHPPELHEEEVTASPHTPEHVAPVEHTSPAQEVHHHHHQQHHENVAGTHPAGPPLFPGWTQKPFDHHTTSEPPHLPEDSHYPSGFEQDYEDDDGASYGPGTCRYGGKVYLSAQQIPRDDPCDFCFCFRSDIICLQQSCPPPIKGCYQETIKGFCCPRYECHVSMATMLNITTTTTTTTTTLPPHFFAHAYKGAAMKAGCQVKGVAYNVGDRIPTTSGPCLQCRCGANGQMKCEPTVCGPQEALLRQVMDAAAVSKKRRR